MEHKNTVNLLIGQLQIAETANGLISLSLGKLFAVVILLYIVVYHILMCS